MSGMRVVLNYTGCFSKAVGSVDRVNAWEAGLRDGLGYIHDLLCYKERLDRLRIIESYSAEGGHLAHRVCTDHSLTQALSP